MPHTGPLQRFDAVHRSNALYATDHVQQIFKHLRDSEARYMVRPDYMTERQTQVTEKMRVILIDWLVDVHLKYKCRPETFYLTANLIDRYLERKAVPKNKLQLVGCACMMVAAKYEEMFPPELSEYVHISANTYMRDEMLQMERSVLNVLEFSLTVPTLYPFVKRWLYACGSEAEQLRDATLYLAEHCTVVYALLQFSPSMQAAACVLLAHRVLRKAPDWPDALAQCSGYSERDLRSCADLLQEWMVRVPTHKLQAIRKKFAHVKYGEVAKLFDRWAQRAGAEPAGGSAPQVTPPLPAAPPAPVV